MAKSRRTSYTSRFEFFDKGRPLSWETSNKKNKVMCHRIERAWLSESIHRELVALGWK